MKCPKCGHEVMGTFGWNDKIAIAADARAQGQKLREGKPKSFRKSVGSAGV